ncbi:MAG: hypothetical protein AAF298_01780 [Cyanobacteria bacterium P01_A01_bin.40]
MIKIKPTIDHAANCPYCRQKLTTKQVLWQGMHTCVESYCTSCQKSLIEDLKVGHAIDKAYQVDLDRNLIFGHEGGKEWLGQPLLESLLKPQVEKINIEKEIFKPSQRVVILNCLDYLYGHSLLKLLNAQRHLDSSPELGLVLIVPKFLRWLVPQGVAEVWTVNLPLNKGKLFYPQINQFIHQECQRFDEIYLSPAYSHPSQFDITRFTKVPKHDFSQPEFRITFIWREDRLWCDKIPFGILRRLKLNRVLLLLQNWKVQRLFKKLKPQTPSAAFTVVGLGKTTAFPHWIEDFRVKQFDASTEQKYCQIYADSRLVIGIHGSNMLLPSSHAGMTIDLMREERWGNFAQDILYQEKDPRLTSFRYRYLPTQTSVTEICTIATNMIKNYFKYHFAMMIDT